MLAEPMNFMISYDVLTKMINRGTGKSTEVLDKLGEMKMRDMPVKTSTMMSHFLRAIWDSDSQAFIKNIKKVMETMTIIPDRSIVDYKDDNAIRTSVIKYLKAMQDIQNCPKEGKFDKDGKRLEKKK